MLIHFASGFVLGLAYVAPIGVQNLFVINSALSKTRWRAYQTAAIVVFFDITLALACFWGIGILIQRFPLLKMAILLAGGLAVIWIGISLLRNLPTELTKLDTNQTTGKIIATACVVTWFNPQAIIDGSLLLGAFRVSLPMAAAGAFILGVCLASASWFFGISTFISFVKDKFTIRIIRIINIICGGIVIFYGSKLIWSFIQLL